MIASPHLTIGGAVGAFVFRRFKPRKIIGIISVSLLALLLGIGSHFFLDAIPHSEYGDMARGPLIVVLFAELFLVAFLTYHFGIKRLKTGNKGEAVVIVAGMIGGALPDLSYVVYGIFGIKLQFLLSLIDINMYFHSTTRLSDIVGFPIQIAVSAIAVYILHWLVIKNGYPR